VDVLTFLIVLALVATLITLLMGLLAMGGSESTSRELSGPLMWTRVGLQGFAVLLLLIAIFLR
jgi:hypothetical protein